MALIRDIAKVCKSKNAGPFDLTVDVVFDDDAMFERVAATGVLSPALFARLYNVEAADVLFTPYPAGRAFKATLPRLLPAGGNRGTHGFWAQQQAPPLGGGIPP